MKRNKLLFTLTLVSLLLFVSCDKNKEKEQSYVFDKSKAEKCDAIEKYIINI